MIRDSIPNLGNELFSFLCSGKKSAALSSVTQWSNSESWERRVLTLGSLCALFFYVLINLQVVTKIMTLILNLI